MTSQVTTTNLEIVEVHSYSRGYHAYMENWDPQLGQCLLLRREPGNSCDKHACSCCPQREIVGHVPYNLVPTFLMFLRREINKGFVEVTDEKVNRGAGYGLEVPCIYRLYRPKAYTDRMKESIENLQASDHC